MLFLSSDYINFPPFLFSNFCSSVSLLIILVHFPYLNFYSSVSLSILFISLHIHPLSLSPLSSFLSIPIFTFFPRPLYQSYFVPNINKQTLLSSHKLKFKQFSLLPYSKQFFSTLNNLSDSILGILECNILQHNYYWIILSYLISHFSANFMYSGTCISNYITSFSCYFRYEDLFLGKKKYIYRRDFESKFIQMHADPFTYSNTHTHRT